MAFFVKANYNRTGSFLVQIFNVNGTPTILASNDVVRVKISRKDSEILDLDSVPNRDQQGGSSVSFNPGTNQVTVWLNQGDFSQLLPRLAYTVDIDVIDANAVSPQFPGCIKHADRGTLIVSPALSVGDMGLYDSSSTSSSSSYSSASSSSSALEKAGH